MQGLFLGIVAVVVSACGGNGATIDGGTDPAQDVVIENVVKETAPPTPTIVDIAAGTQHTCAILNYGGQHVTYCFGADDAVGGTKQGLLAIAGTGAGTSMNLLSIV